MLSPVSIVENLPVTTGDQRTKEEVGKEVLSIGGAGVILRSSYVHPTIILRSRCIGDGVKIRRTFKEEFAGLVDPK